MLTPTLDEATQPPGALWPRLHRAAESFLLPAGSAKPLAILRIGIAAILLVQAAMVHTEILAWFSRTGIFQGDLAASLAPSFGPRIAHFVVAFAPLGLSETQVIQGLGAGYLVALVCLAIGLGTRISAATAWFLHWTFMNSADPLLYGVDQYAHIFLFYLIWVPAGHTLAVDALLFRLPERSTSATLGLRVMQMHLAISYFASGIEKAQLFEWWNGDVIFRALSLPDFRQFDLTWLAQYPILAQLACLGTLAVELGYIVFIWPKRTRNLWLAAILGLHLGIAIFLGLHFFGAIMCVLNFALFHPASLHEATNRSAP